MCITGKGIVSTILIEVQKARCMESAEKNESVQHLISERKKLAQRKCKRCHDKVAEIMQ